MANSTATFTINGYPTGIDNSLNLIRVYGTVEIGAGNYVANGIPVSINGPEPYTGVNPFFGTVYSGSSGYVYRFDPAHQSIRIFEAPSAGPNPLTELTAGAATPAGVTGDTIYMEAVTTRT